MISRRTALAGGAAMASVAACAKPPEAPQTLFAGQLNDWAREIARDDPEFATDAGLGADIAGAGFETRLTDRSAQAVDVRRAAALRRLAQLRAIPRGAARPEEKLTYDILADVFATAADAARFAWGDFDSLGGLRPYTLNPLDSAFVGLPDFFSATQPINVVADADAYLARLRHVAAALDAESERSAADAAAGVVPPDFMIDRALGALSGLITSAVETSPYVDGLQRRLTALNSASADDQRRVQRAIAAAIEITRDEIYPAQRRAFQTLQTLRPRAVHDAGVWRLPDGENFYRTALRLETTTTRSPEEIHQIGLDRVAHLSSELDIGLRQLGMTEGPIGPRLAQLTADPRYRYEDSDAGRAQLIADVQARVNAMLSRANQWFGALPRARLEVRRVPAFAEDAQSGAYYNPPSLDGARPGIYYVNLRDMTEMTKIDLPTQDYHEAVPGHHFQIALAQQQTQLPLLRRLLSFNAYTEGWGLYAEQLADELGFYENDRIGRLGFLRWQMWRAARLVVDTGLHALRWSREQAIDYLSGVTGDAAGVIVSEVERYCVWPGQACGYEIGRSEISRLREYARNQLGVKFDLRSFHDAILLNGEMPLSALDAHVRDWVSRTR